MVLINTSLAPCNPFYHRLRPKNYPALTLLLFGSAIQRENLILKLTSTRSRRENLGPVLAQWIAYAEKYPITNANILRQLKAALGYRAARTAPTVKTLLLAGLQDQLVNAKCSLKLSQQWNCTFKLHPTAGHDLSLDDSVWVISQLKKWLKS